MSTNKTKYGAKLASQISGTYQGNSPFYKNIPEFQHLKPLTSYPHLKGMRAEIRRPPEQQERA